MPYWGKLSAIRNAGGIINWGQKGQNVEYIWILFAWKKKLWNVISRICLRSNHHSQTGSRRERLPLKTTQQVNTHQQNTQTQTQTHNYHSKQHNRLTTNKGQQTHKGQKNTQLSRKLFLEKHCFYIKSQKVAN